MKPDRHPEKGEPSPAVAPAQSGRSPANSSNKLWLFRLLALTAIPILLIGVLEMGLRIAGYGYKTNFFLPAKIQGHDAFVENQQYGWRFFPRQLARRPPHMAINSEKSKDTVRIFVFGESAAMGDPEPAFSFGRILQALLRERFPDTKFDVINVAFTAINSHVIRPQALECANHKGDIWLVYAGNNEVVGPFGPGTVLGKNAQSLGLIRAGIALKAWKVGQLIESLQAKGNKDGATPRAWGGMKMFQDNQIASQDPRLNNMAAAFRSNLEDIIEVGQKAGAKVIISSVASNLKDCAPFASVHRADLSAADLDSWKKAYESGLQREASKDWAEAITHFTRAAQIDPEYAEVQYRIGHCYLASGKNAEAGAAFERARDLDALRFRTDSKLNALLQQIAAERKASSVGFIDAEKAIAEQSPSGVIGEEFFFDHVHLNYEGNYRMARLFAEEVFRQLPPERIKVASGDWLDAKQCRERIAMTGWNEYQMYESMQQRLGEAPFTNQINHPARQQYFRQKLASLIAAIQPDALTEAVAVCRQAVQASSGDYFLQENLAKLLLANGESAEAIVVFKELVKMLPHAPTAYYNIGHVLNTQGKGSEARNYFMEALNRRSDYADAYVGIGQAFLSEGKWDEAIQHYSRALEINPENLEAQVALGQAWEKKENFAKAIEYFRIVVDRAPNSFQARMHLGNAYTAEGKLFNASEQFSEAVRLQPDSAMRLFTKAVQSNPDNPTAHYHLANALAAAGDRVRAEQSLEKAVQLKPEFWEARYLLGIELASRDRIKEAELQFSEVVRIKPDFALAHLNLGVALARQTRFQEALTEFQATLQLDPNNQQAKQHIATIRSMVEKRR